VEEFKSSRVQEFKSSRVEEERNPRAQAGVPVLQGAVVRGEVGGLDAGGYVFEAIGDVGDGLDWHGDVDVFGVVHGVDGELALTHGDADVVGGVANVDEFGVGIFLELFREFAKHGQIGADLGRNLLQIPVGRQMESERDGGGGDPEVDMGAAAAVLVHIDTDDAFVEDVNASKS
jgi:hypothetical protein